MTGGRGAIHCARSTEGSIDGLADRSYRPVGGRDKSRPYRASGFSLMEMLLVVALFSTLAVILSQTFVSFNRQHRKISNAAVLGQDMRFAMELVTRSARQNQIDYSAAPLPLHAGQLALTTAGGGSLVIATRAGSAECADPSVARCLALSTDGGTTWQPITATHVNVDRFDVYVRPSSSPFVQSGGAYSSNVQPFVTVSIGLTYRADNPKDNSMLEAQTTVSSRIYQR